MIPVRPMTKNDIKVGVWVQRRHKISFLSIKLGEWVCISGISSGELFYIQDTSGSTEPIYWNVLDINEAWE